MIPVIYDADATDFLTNGYGRLSDAISCTVSEELNGAFTLTMVYPKDGIHASDIAIKRIIKVKANDDASSQRFRITKINESSDGSKLTINANHISYDLNGYPMGKFTVTGIDNVLKQFTENCLVNHNFTFETDISNATTKYSVKYPKSIRACLGGEDESMLQYFKCELEFNNNTVILHTTRGSDNHVTIRYGKNLESYVKVRSAESVYNGVLAYWYKQDDQTLVMGDIQYKSGATFPTDKIFILDVSNEYEDAPTKAVLNKRANKYIKDNNIGVSYVDSVEIKFVPLWQTEEYKNIIDLEHVSMGDTVHVYYNGTTTDIRMLEYEYDCLNERYITITLGHKKPSFTQAVRQVVKKATKQEEIRYTKPTPVPVVVNKYSINNVASYLRSETQSVASSINALSDDWDSFVFITDTHGNANQQHSQAIGMYLLDNTDIKMIVLGGDYSENAWSKTEYDTYMSPFVNSEFKDSIYAIMGNHEHGGMAEAKQSIYNDFLKSKSWLKGSPANNYYYFDDTDTKTRYLFLNTSDGSGMYVMSSTQINWIRNAVKLPSTAWSLLVIGHVNLAVFGNVTTDNETNGADIISAINTCNGTIIGYLCGHQHIDMTSKIGNFQHTTLLCDKLENIDYYPGISVTDRVSGTASEQAVSVVSINRSTKNVVIRRVGAGRNRTISYSY